MSDSDRNLQEIANRYYEAGAQASRPARRRTSSRGDQCQTAGTYRPEDPGPPSLPPWWPTPNSRAARNRHPGSGCRRRNQESDRSGR